MVNFRSDGWRTIFNADVRFLHRHRHTAAIEHLFKMLDDYVFKTSGASYILNTPQIEEDNSQESDRDWDALDEEEAKSGEYRRQLNAAIVKISAQALQVLEASIIICDAREAALQDSDREAQVEADHTPIINIADAEPTSQLVWETDSFIIPDPDLLPATHRSTSQPPTNPRSNRGTANNNTPFLQVPDNAQPVPPRRRKPSPRPVAARMEAD